MILRPLLFPTKNATVHLFFPTQATSACLDDSQGIQFSTLSFQKLAAFSLRYHTLGISRRVDIFHIYLCCILIIHGQFELIWSGCWMWDAFHHIYRGVINNITKWSESWVKMPLILLNLEDKVCYMVNKVWSDMISKGGRREDWVLLKCMGWFTLCLDTLW
jgi:hypothetical protein